MKPAVLRLLVPAVLFAAWLAYLGWLVAGQPLQAEGYPLVVSRPQILASEADVVAQLPERTETGGKAIRATIAEVLHDTTGKLKVGQTLDIGDLDACHPVRRAEEPPPDWVKAGLYLLPLRRVQGMASQWEIAPIPPSPGFHHHDVRRIYAATAEARAQYARVAKP